jgi:hypothetical protein
MTNLRLIHPILVAAPLLILWMRFRTTGWPVTGPSWLATAVAVLALLDVALAVLLERQLLRDPTASRLRAKGQSPEQSVALVGMVLMLAPVCCALFASFLGLAATHLAWYAVASVVGVGLWGVRYRRVIYTV